MLALLLGGATDARAASLKYHGESLAAAVQAFARTKGGNLTVGDLRIFLVSLSKQETDLPEIVQWPGEQFGVLLQDIDGDGIEDIALAHLETQTKATLNILLGKDNWALFKTYDFTFGLIGYIRHTEVLFLDLNHDGKGDFYVRFFEGAQTPASKDCILVTGATFFTDQYRNCFSQVAASVPPDSFIQPIVNETMYQLSYIADFDSNGTYEIVVTSYINRDKDHASWGVWADIYKWDKDRYRLANREFPRYYTGFKKMLEKQIKDKKGRAAIDPSYKQTLQQLLQKISVVLPKEHGKK